MAKGGLLKTLRKYNPLKRVSTTLILIVLLIIILFSVFNRKIIENLAPNNTSGRSTTAGSTTGGSSTGGSTTGGSTTGGSTTGGPTPIRTNNKHLEVHLWYDSKNISGTQGERIVLYDDFEKAAKIEGDNYVSFIKNKAEDYIAFFMTDPSFSNLKSQLPPDVNWETWKKNFMDVNAPLISFSVLDKSQGNTTATGAKRKYLAALWHTMPASYDILNYMLIANKYANEIGVAKP